MKRQIVIDPGALAPVINGAWAWSNYLAVLAAKGRELNLPDGGMQAHADELLLRVTILSDATGIPLPHLDDPMKFGG